MEGGGLRAEPLPRHRRRLRQGTEPPASLLQPLLQGGGTAGGWCRERRTRPRRKERGWGR